MRTLRWICILLFTAIAVACSDKKAETESAARPSGVIPQAQLDALNKAKNVESQIMEDAARQREQADQQGQ